MISGQAHAVSAVFRSIQGNLHTPGGANDCGYFLFRKGTATTGMKLFLLGEELYTVQRPSLSEKMHYVRSPIC